MGRGVFRAKGGYWESGTSPEDCCVVLLIPLETSVLKLRTHLRRACVSVAYGMALGYAII